MFQYPMVSGYRVGAYGRPAGGPSMGHPWNNTPPAMAVPRPGEIRIQPTPDDERSIRTVLDEMVDCVREAAHDPAVFSMFREIVKSVAHLEGTPNYRVAQLAVWYEWCKAHLQYINDPISIVCDGQGCRQTASEIVQTVGRMQRQLRRPAALLEAIVGPELLGTIITAVGGMEFQIPASLREMVPADCDEHGILTAAGPASGGIETAFRLGGHWERKDENDQPLEAPALALHHVWGIACVEYGPTIIGQERWWDMDTTIKHFQLGQHAPFEQYATQFIFRMPPVEAAA